MKKLAFVALVAGLVSIPSLAGILPAHAMVPASPDLAIQSLIVPVAGGCGPGKHRGPRGGCRNNFARPWQHACPRGYHIGPGGRCRGNGR
jgi:hypothetical protein